MEEKNFKIGLTFDDVLLTPMYSEILPTEVDLGTQLTKKIRLNIPLMSAAMDTVTEAELAIAIANQGGIGIIHKNMPIEDQAKQVRKVKKFSSWIIDNPVCLSPEDKIRKAVEMMNELGFSGFPVIKDNAIVGIITNRDLRFKKNLDLDVKDVMSLNPITAKENISHEEAIKLFDNHKIEKLPVVNSKGVVIGLITTKDIEKMQQFPNAGKDGKERLLCGAAVGVFDFGRVKSLIDAGADVIVVDSAHGHSKNIIDTIKKIKSEFDVQVIGGNVATGQGAEALIRAGADAVKVGVGPGSICTTRIISGAGVPQITAIQECAEIADRYNIPVIGDGGIKYSGDIAKAIAAGASCVMIGNLLAGTEESPGKTVFIKGRKFKQYRGMGSLGAMQKGSKDRYGQKYITDTKKLVAEGIEGIVPYKGTIAETVYQLMGGLKSAMGYCGTRTIDELRTKPKFLKITNAGLKESHPHDVIITQEAPNYSKS
ncbi:IMP dehydrogenase [Candidatus Woesearchaeota archaeon]|nr:IMP dehydrogenase [Candidatus Woesearchaeota archaeon]